MLVAPALRRLADPLLCEDGRVAILAVARRLPAPITSLFGFECRLADHHPVADFLVCVDADHGEHHALPEVAAATDAGAAGDLWRRVAAFGRTWQTAGSAFDGRVRTLWLEFDVVPQPAPVPTPSVFFAPMLEAATSAASRRAVIADVMAALGGAPLDPAAEQQIARCLDALPPSAVVMHAGRMLARDDETVRLCLAGIPLDAIPDYLVQLGAAALGRETAACLGRYRRHIGRAHLTIDAGARLGPRAGLECYAPLPNDDEAVLHYEPQRWRAFLDDLVAEGLCIAAKRAALLDYVGFSHEQAEPHVWAALPSAATAAGRRRPLNFMTRFINHVKLDLHADGRPPAAKAYPAARYFSVKAFRRAAATGEGT